MKQEISTRKRINKPTIILRIGTKKEDKYNRTETKKEPKRKLIVPIIDRTIDKIKAQPIQSKKVRSPLSLCIENLHIIFYFLYKIQYSNQS